MMWTSPDAENVHGALLMIHDQLEKIAKSLEVIMIFFEEGDDQ